MKAVLVVFVFGFVASVFGHAGLNYPAPAGPVCTATSPLTDCGFDVPPCGNNNVTSYTNLIIGAYGVFDVDVLIYQRVSHFDPMNYYQINYWNPTTMMWDNLGQFFQGTAVNVSAAGAFTVKVTLPYSSNTKTVLQMIFNATSGPAAGSVYYSCAGIWVNPPCADNAECVQENQQCQSMPVNDGSKFKSCNPADTFCNNGTCTKFAVGSPCLGICDNPGSSSNPQDILFGIPSLYCSGTFPGVCNTTTIINTVGASCANPGDYCAPGLFCYSVNSTCQKLAAYGEDCSLTMDWQCAPSLSCNFTGKCDILFTKQAGDRCNGDNDCVAGLACNSTSATSYGWCVNPVASEAGKNCSYQPGEGCGFGFTCLCTAYNTDTQHC